MSQELKQTLERNARAMSLRPGIATGTATTLVTVGEGLRCQISDGAWTLTTDLGASDGGEATAPDPGVLVRAGLGACLAQGYVMWAARLDVPLTRVRVTVEADYDGRGMYGFDGVAPGWRAVRYVTEIDSSAPRERVLELVGTADAHSPILDDFRRALPIERELRVTEA